MIKVILKENIPGHGSKNDVVDVSDGFARNFLIPRNKAVIAVPDAIRKIEEEKSRTNLKEEKIKEKNSRLEEKINSMEITIQGKAKEGRLFGSISSKEISETLSEKGIYIDPKKIIITEAIKTIGTHKVGIILDKDIQAILKINVVEEG